MSTRPAPIAHVTTVIPARNEEHRIAACLASVERARTALPADVASSVVVVADACDDSTAVLAEAWLDPHTDAVLRRRVGSAGAARRVGTSVAIERAALDPRRVWVCSTDADSTVPIDWFLSHLDFADRGFVAVAGVVELDADAEAVARREFRHAYRMRRDGSHSHVHGANLGFRADAYLLAGGWADIATAEDHDLWERLAMVGRTISPARLVATTSGRLVGRAPDGFAARLSSLVAAAEDVA